LFEEASEELATVHGVGERLPEQAGRAGLQAQAENPLVQAVDEGPGVPVADLAADLERGADQPGLNGEQIAEDAEGEQRFTGVVMASVEEVAAKVAPAPGPQQALLLDG
jgi:hypothetical protein